MTFSPDTHCPFRRRRKEARPAELLDAALQLFVEKGFAATRSEEVARLAGVSKGTLYLYFPSKEELLKAVIQQFLAERIAEGARRADEFEQEGAATPEVMENLLSDWWMQVYDSPASGVFKLVIAEARNFPDIARFYAERVIVPGTELCTRLLRRGVQRGEFRDIDVDAAAHSILMPLVLLCVHKHSLEPCGISKSLGSDPEGFIRAHLRLVLHGLLVRPGAAGPGAPDSPPR